MLTARNIYLCILLLGCTTVGWAQKTYRQCYGFDCKENKWSVSAFAGYPVSGLGKDIQNQLEHSRSDLPGLTPEPILRCFPKEHHAELKSDLSWNIEARYALTRKHAIALTTGKLNGHAITGYALNELGQFFELKSNTYHISLNYVRKLRRGRDEVNIGPVMAMHKMNFQQPSSAHQGSSKLTAGLNIGYTLSLIKTERWSLGFKTNYTWLPDTAVGPYTVEHKLQRFGENSDTCTSSIKTTKVSLQTLQFGLTTGWRF